MYYVNHFYSSYDPFVFISNLISLYTLRGCLYLYYVCIDKPDRRIYRIEPRDEKNKPAHIISNVQNTYLRFRVFQHAAISTRGQIDEGFQVKNFFVRGSVPDHGELNKYCDVFMYTRKLLSFQRHVRRDCGPETSVQVHTLWVSALVAVNTNLRISRGCVKHRHHLSKVSRDVIKCFNCISTKFAFGVDITMLCCL